MIQRAAKTPKEGVVAALGGMKNRTDLRAWFNREMGRKFGEIPVPKEEKL